MYILLFLFKIMFLLRTSHRVCFARRFYTRFIYIDLNLYRLYTYIYAIHVIQYIDQFSRERFSHARIVYIHMH